MSEAARDAVLAEHLQTLKLPAIRRSYEALARQANDGGWAYQDYLRELLEAEVVSRRERTAASRLREAHFPEVKTLDQIDWQALSGVSRPKILELASCEYLKQAQDVVLAGPIGTGKTHLAIALGVEAGAAAVSSSAGRPIWCATCERRVTSVPWDSSTGVCNVRICSWWTSSASCRSIVSAASCCSTCFLSATRHARRS